MALSIGIVGLPNVGKSTTFNALTREEQAEAANYPFCTIDPNKAIVPVPDARLDRLAALVSPARVVPATIEFVDIAGLVEGASKGEGLGNTFLSHIRETAAIVHVVRCFDDDNVVHVNGSPDPQCDIEIIETELTLADIEQIERKLERLSKQVKGDKKLQPLLDMAQRLRDHMDAGSPARSFPDRDTDACKALFRELQPLTAKTVIYCANVDEDGLSEDNDYVQALMSIAKDQDSVVVKICAKIEEEMAGLSDDERNEFLESLGVEESGLDQIIRKGYRALGLISYFTAGPKEVRAWTVRHGAKAPEAAGVIHGDFERGFIRAEVISFDAYIEDEGEAGAKAKGHMNSEGKEYEVRDGDVVLFRFNV